MTLNGFSFLVDINRYGSYSYRGGSYERAYASYAQFPVVYVYYFRLTSKYKVLQLAHQIIIPEE